MEYIKLIPPVLIQIIAALIQLAAVIVVWKSFKNSILVRAETLDWNRKLATEKVLSEKQNPKVTRKMRETFNIRERHDVISLEEIESKNDPALDGQINHYLNRFERLSRGMEYGIYDPVIVKSALKTVFLKTYTNFSAYIDKMQNDFKHENAFKYFKITAEKWLKEDSEEQ